MNTHSEFRASAPGSLMLMGEHAVLHGKRCLVTAVDRRMKVTLRPRPDDRVTIDSALGAFSARLGEVVPEPPFTFVLTAVRQRAAVCGGGFTLEIESEFPETVGLGSSAAVTVALHAALTRWCGRIPDEHELCDQALATIRSVQGMGSGADVAASIWGGTIVYRSDPREVDVLPRVCPVVAVYSGSKTPTPEVVRHVEALRQEQPAAYALIYDAVDALIPPAAEAVRNEDWATLCRLFNIQHGLMDAMGVSNREISELVYRLREEPDILGSKISGSGLGDCVIGIGRRGGHPMQGELLEVKTSTEGVCCDPV